MSRQKINRVIFYAAGLLILALGIILNTKAGLGVSPIISVAYSISQIRDWNFGNTTLGLYTVFVVLEMFMHTVKIFMIADMEMQRLRRQRSIP